MTSDSHPAFSMPSSPRSSTSSTRAETPGASSDMSSFSSLSMNERQKHDSFILSGSVYLITSDGRTLNLPIPSESPFDPLSWEVRKRAIAFACVAIFIYAGLVMMAGASASLSGLAADFPPEKTSPFSIQALVTAPTLFMGIGSFIWVPMTFAVGRRPTFVAASLMLFISCVGASISRTFFQLLVCICFAGIAEGFSVTVAFLIVIDLTFIHNRPSMIAIYWSINGFLGTLSTVIVPYTTRQGLEWRHFYGFWSFVTGFAFFSVLLFFPETYFKRPAVAYDGRTFVQTASEKLKIYKDDDLESLNRSIYNKVLPTAPHRSWVREFLDQFRVHRASRTSWKSMMLSYPQIFFCLLNPLIFWVVVMRAANEAGFMYIVSSYPTILNSPPYKASGIHTVLMNISGAIGYFLGWPLGGILLRAILNRLSKRNGGVREAEHYLVGYIFPILTAMLSNIIFGLATKYHWSPSAYYISYLLSTFSNVAMGITTMLWVTEAFPRWAAPALVVVIGGSLILSYSLSFSLVPWIAKQGFMVVGIELAALQLVTGLVFVPAAFWGKGLRQRIHGRWAESREGAIRPL